MQVKDFMTRDPVAIPPDMTLQEAAARMRELDVGFLPISDGASLAGVITDRDITVRATADGIDPSTNVVRNYMTATEVVCVYEDQDAWEAATIMQEHQVRRLPVLDRNHRLVGIISLGDLAVDTGDETLSGKVLEEVSKPAEPHR